jgi:transposase
MPAIKECPLCGGSMRLRVRQEVLQIRGNPSATVRTANEWLCPDCDYFEEAEGESR